MGSSFVQYKGFGFWTRDAFLENWLTTLLAEMQQMPGSEPWQESLMRHWSTQIVTDGGVMSLELDEFLSDGGREAYLLALAKRALDASKPLGRRTGELFVELLAGRLNTTASSPIDYLDWPDT